MLGIAAHATTLAQMDLAQLAHAAQVVARVRCMGSESRRDSGHIWTFTRFSVVEAMQGSPDATLLVRLPGGRDGHVIENVDGVPRFSPGEETILFLERTRLPRQAGGGRLVGDGVGRRDISDRARRAHRTRERDAGFEPHARVRSRFANVSRARNRANADVRFSREVGVRQ